ncbi:hypothetical protein [Kitasatospora sp. NPDC017646]|uniref:hypothetical protein n=1 Tax=Kitasatospora sp. NPDC017646 TaxID=3364024 RepID=UPI0037AF9183
MPSETVLRRWLDALSAAVPLGAGTDRPLDDDQRATCLAVLLSVLSNAGGTLDAGDVRARILEMARAGQWSLPHHFSLTCRAPTAPSV